MWSILVVDSVLGINDCLEIHNAVKGNFLCCSTHRTVFPQTSSPWVGNCMKTKPGCYSPPVLFGCVQAGNWLLACTSLPNVRIPSVRVRWNNLWSSCCVEESLINPFFFSFFSPISNSSPLLKCQTRHLIRLHQRVLTTASIASMAHHPSVPVATKSRSVTSLPSVTFPSL